MYNHIKSRFMSILIAIVTVFTLIPAVPALAADVPDLTIKEVADSEVATRSGKRNYGALGRMGSNATVYSDAGLSQRLGSLSKGEGVTVIWYDDTVAYINYSSSASSTGYRFGYINRYTLSGGQPYTSHTDVGIVTTSGTTYYDPNGNNKAGSVSQGEYVALLSRANGWDYIEYNVANGKRKRAFIPSYCINHQYGTALPYHEYTVERRSASIDGWTAVYSGPDSLYYEQCGSITPEVDNAYLFSHCQEYDRNGNPMSLMSYRTSSGTIKYGWIAFNHNWAS